MSDEKPPIETTQEEEEQSKAEELIDNLSPEERIKWREKFLQLEYYKAISKTIFQVAKDFSQWAVLLMSGVGSIIGGWFSLRKMAKKEKVELKGIELRSNRMESRAGKPSLLDERHAGGQRQYSLSPSKKEEAVEADKGRAGDVRKELEAIRTPMAEIKLDGMLASEVKQPFYMDSSLILSVVSIFLFIATSLKMFVYDKFKKKGRS